MKIPATELAALKELADRVMAAMPQDVLGCDMVLDELVITVRASAIVKAMT